MSMLMMDPRQRDPLEEAAQKLAEGVRSVFRGLSSIFSSETETEVETTTRTVVAEPTLSYVGNVLVNDAVTFDTYYLNKIYNQVPESLCDSYNSVLDRFRMRFPNGSGRNLSYEDILKLHMDMAADASVLGWVDGINGLMSFFTKISIPMPSTQTIALSLIWASMIYDLESKHSSSPISSEKSKIAKMCIGLLGFASQVFHREMPLWSWIGTVYKSFAMAGDYVKESPYLYQKLFPNKYIDIRRFPNWHKELEKHVDRDDKVTIGQAFNICYTFRVGDIYLHSVLNNSSYFDDKLKQRLIDSLSPVPRERDLMRIFDLYTKPYIY